MGDDFQKRIKKQKQILEDWKNELKNYLSQNLYRNQNKIKLYIIEKDWMKKYINEILSSPFNDNREIELKLKAFPIINNNKLYNANSDYIYIYSEFFILNENAWNSLVTDQKNTLILKIYGSFFNKKLIFDIGDWNYYFYYLQSNEIKKGYISFSTANKKTIDEILNNLMRVEINCFIKTFLSKVNPIFNAANKTFKYKVNNFELILKDQENRINTEQKNLNENQNNESFSRSSLENGPSDSTRNTINLIKEIDNNDEPLNYNKLIKSLYYYYESKRDYFIFINGKASIGRKICKYKEFIGINRDWIEEFEKTFLFDKIKNELSKYNNINESDNLKIISKILDPNEIASKKMTPIEPLTNKKTEKHIIKIDYFDNYELDLAH